MATVIKNFEACEKRDANVTDVTWMLKEKIESDLLKTKGAFYSVNVIHIIKKPIEFWCRYVFSKSTKVDINEKTCKRSLQLLKKDGENVVISRSKYFCNLACARLAFENLRKSCESGEVICSILMHTPKN